MTGQGIGCRIGLAGLVDYPVLKTGQFRVHLELPLGLQALISEVHEATLVSKDGKFAVLEISTPLLDCHYDCQELLFISRQSSSSGAKCFANKSKRVAIL